MQHTAPLLDYQQSTQPKRRLLLLAATLVLAIAALITAYWCLPYLKHQLARARFEWAMHKCRLEHHSPDQVMWESDPTAANRLIASDSNYARFGNAAGFVSPDWQRLVHTPVGQLGAPVGMGVPGCWWALAASGPASDLFVQERTTPGGRHVLLRITYDPAKDVIEACAANIGSYDVPFDRSGTIFLGGFHEPGLFAFAWPDDNASAGFRNPRTSLRIYAAQPDPHDSSRAVVRFFSSGKAGQLTVRVLDCRPGVGTDEVPIRIYCAGAPPFPDP